MNGHHVETCLSHTRSTSSLRLPCLLGTLLGVVAASRTAQADVPLEERLQADCIDRANARIKSGRPLLLRPSVGPAFAWSDFGPMMSPGTGTRVGADADVLVDPAPGSTDWSIPIDANVIYSPSVRAYSAWAALGWNRRDYPIQSLSNTPGDCQISRYDLQGFGGPWFSALSGASTSLDTRLGGIAGAAYRRLNSWWGFEVMPAIGLTFNLARPEERPDESKRLVTGLLRLGGSLRLRDRFWISLVAEGRVTTDERGLSFLLGVPVELF